LPCSEVYRSRANPLGQFALEINGLLYMKPFKVTVFGVAFELGERGCRGIN
jgi:hypothetical protein